MSLLSHPYSKDDLHTFKCRTKIGEYGKGYVFVFFEILIAILIFYSNFVTLSYGLTIYFLDIVYWTPISLLIGYILLEVLYRASRNIFYYMSYYMWGREAAPIHYSPVTSIWQKRTNFEAQNLPNLSLSGCTYTLVIVTITVQCYRHLY